MSERESKSESKRERVGARTRERGKKIERARKQEGTLFLIFINIVMSNVYHEGCQCL